MSLFRLTKEHFEKFELITHPRREFASSSSGLTGSVALFTDSSTSIKELASTFGKASGSVNENTLDEERERIADIVGNAMVSGNVANVYNATHKYLELVNSQSSSPFLNKKQEIIRFTPGVKFNQNLLRKAAIKDILFPYYRNVFPTAQWTYTNYHTLNFVTGGNLSTDSVLIYPAGTGSVEKENFNPLGPATRFTFDFWINPRYTTENVGDEFLLELFET